MITPAQKQAIESQSPAILVLAGAGSGKTFTVVQRIVRLVKSGTNSASILCLTFTRKAAKELKERLEKLIGKDARKIWAGTFHSISYRILSAWGERIGYMTTGGEKITIITPDEAESILKTVREEYGWNGTQKAIEEAKSKLAHKGDFPEDPSLARIIREYWSRLKECNAVDYDQLLLEVHRIFRECPDALLHYQNRFSHIFVDEYQDTDTIQYSLHEVLRPQFLFAVGDIRQGIYSWRGAEISIIKDFEQAHPGAEVIDLLECFRCGRPIVEAANRLIAHNPEGKKGLIPTVEGGNVSVRRGGPLEIAEYLSEDLALEDPGQIAVIARTHRILEETLAACQEKGLDVFKIGSASNNVKDLAEWKTFHAVLRMVLNPMDNIAFWSFGADWLRLSADQRKTLKGVADAQGDAILHVLARESGEEFSHAKRVYNELSEGKNTDSALFSFKLFVANGTPSQSYVSAMGRVEQYLKENGAEQMTPAEWLQWVSTRDMHSELESGANKEKITLLTAHAAKGLEWENVILAGFNAGEFPSARSARTGIDEERRLAYVAMTRAKKNLVVFSDKEPSRFITEAGI
jgi:DNA helicase II / ATP-dependent DNA helicase PcrA